MARIKITSYSHAKNLLRQAKQVADPIQRGDKPYEFSRHALTSAFDKAAAVYNYAFEQLKDSTEPHMYKSSELLVAGTYVATLAEVLRQRRDTTHREREQIRKTNADIVIKREKISTAIARAPLPMAVRR